jgi:hypothetical protein
LKTIIYNLNFLQITEKSFIISRKNNRYTLAEASQQLLTKLTATLTIVAYVSTEEEKRRPIKELVARYQQHKKELEANTETKLVEPLFAALGWTKDDFVKK